MFYSTGTSPHLPAVGVAVEVTDLATAQVLIKRGMISETVISAEEIAAAAEIEAVADAKTAAEEAEEAAEAAIEASRIAGITEKLVAADLSTMPYNTMVSFVAQLGLTAEDSKKATLSAALTTYLDSL